MARSGCRREQRHADGPRRLPRWIGWVPEVLVVLVVLVAVGQAQYDLGHRWLGLDQADPGTQPAEVLPPLGLDLPAGTPAAAVADPADATSALDPVAVRAVLAKRAADSRLGSRVGVLVSDLASGTTVFRRGTAALTPASTTKLLTSVAALESLGPMTRFSTRVLGQGGAIVLVGGGDPMLASSPEAAKGLYPARADLVTLAARTARSLRAQGVSQVQLTYDASLFTGDAVNPAWPADYRPDDVVPPITALWADQGRKNGLYDDDPAKVAAETFAGALAASGIKVLGPPRPGRAPAGADELGVVRSAPVGEIVQRVLTVSDNNAAEVLARQVGLAVDGDPSFVGGAKAVFSVLRGLGVDVSGSRIFDGSGLSRKNALTTTTLLGVVRAAASADHPALREGITGLPVAGFTGSLDDRFDTGAAAARGRVLAKTGTLSGVRSLAGVAQDLDGNLIGFVIVADRIGGDPSVASRLIDEMAAALGACHCGSASPGPSPAS